jgi:hypothetical protein
MRASLVVFGAMTALLGCSGGTDTTPPGAGGSGGAAASSSAATGDGGAGGGTTDCSIGQDPACVVQPDVVAIAVTTPQGKAPTKGDVLRIKLTVQNLGKVAGMVSLTPLLDSKRFTDFTAVALAPMMIDLAAGEQKEITEDVGPFVDDEPNAKHYALGRGAYAISGVRVAAVGSAEALDQEYSGKDFIVAASNVVFNAVVFDQKFLDHQPYQGTAEEFMVETHTRRSELFTPDAPGSSTGKYTKHPGGFDEMMGVRHLYRTFSAFAASDAGGGYCEQAGAYAHTALGLTRDWDIKGEPTNPDHHGFDILSGLTPNLGGGATCGWLGTEVIGLFDFDLSLNRSEIIAVHETGHVFGAPHCDPLQGYVMCSGEKHPHYLADGTFVWHQVSRDAMKNPYD